MHNGATDTHGSEPSDLERREGFLADLNARIARLAIALHVPLESDADVIAAMKTLSENDQNPLLQAHADDYSPEHIGEHGAQRRLSGLRAELRGLLVLRYGVEQRTVEQFGVQATHQIMAEAEAQLQREGFRPGADGVNLDRIFESK